jgi:hypothetical protein
MHVPYLRNLKDQTEGYQNNRTSRFRPTYNIVRELKNSDVHEDKNTGSETSKAVAILMELVIS